MIELPHSEDAYRLLHEGAVALAEVEANGMSVDVGYIEGAIAKAERRIKRMEARLQRSEVWRTWRKVYGRKANLGSDVQLGKVLFDHMGLKAAGDTAGGRYSTSEAALSTVDHPFIADYLGIKKLRKALGTNLRGILREVVDGKIHCFFNLHTVRTYRSSSSDFNFQNVPIRDEAIARIIRRGFVARPGRQIAEIDIQGAEVRVSACYNKDPRLIDYILDETKDMHRDMAVELYKLPVAEVSKPIRHAAKNQFVFPQFYGDWYIDCAQGLWHMVDKNRLVTTSGKPLRQHLQEVGFTGLGDLDPKADPEPGTFEAHVKRVERNFWERRFAVYNRWRRTWYDQYRRQGWFQSLTGFICQGFMGKNDVINYPVQGSAFHCLLWALIRLVRVEMRKRKMGSLIVGQIHDSIVADVVPAELDDFLALCRYVLCEQLPREWRWLIVPMKIEADVAPVGGSWVDKKEYKLD